MTRPIAISLSPNTEKDDVLLALKTLFNLLKWFDRSEVEKLEEEFAQWFGGGYHALAVNSGRSAQYLILKGLGIGQGDEVAIQAFTCVAVPNSVLWTGAKPLYIDIDSTYNMDPEDLKRKLTPKTKAVIVQHTFGIPARVDQIRKIAEENGLYLIEDCAHALGGTYKGKLLGSFGDAAFFSFGRDKIISSIFGGMILFDKSKKELFNRVKRLRDALPKPPDGWTVQQLLHPIAFSAILPVYPIGVGKLLLVLLQKFGLLSRAVYGQEKEGKQPDVFPAQMPPALAVLARNQLKKLTRFNGHRAKIVQYYLARLAGLSGITLPHAPSHGGWDVQLRFPVQVGNSPSLIEYARKRGAVLGDWYKEVIAPCPDPTVVGYEWSSCPGAEEVAQHIVNLPTYPTLSEKEAERVVQLIKQWLATQ